MIMTTIRQKQLSEFIKRNFSLYLQQEGRYLFGSEAFVTVTNVILSPDLGIAKIYLSVYNTDNKQAVILHLEDNYPHIKKVMGSRLKSSMRRIPEFSFFLDDTLDEMYRLRGLFQKLHADHQMGDGNKEEE